ncbi:hypothetical protein NCR96_09035 [Helicobacter sp. 14348-15]|uniref:hypothetical protein n=1 Tax=Helicobacter TaxID=209 RepID=UPI001F584EB3|nr:MULTISPECIES: hypothetical protein [Helicobacter]MCI2236853.1 hypothetical protein [Helicobacter sp. CaF467b]MCL9821877.1 hypothetical protein [Helicobacter colisuis]
MKTLLTAILLTLSIPYFSFACGGCTDSYLGSQMAEQGKQSYNVEEQEIFTEIETLNAFLDSEIIKTQESALRENEILLSLEKNKNINEKNQNFYFKQQNEIQGVINTIKAVKE